MFFLLFTVGVQVLERVGAGRLQLAEGGLLPVPGGRGQRGRGELGEEVWRLPQSPQPQRLPGNVNRGIRIEVLHSVPDLKRFDTDPDPTSYLYGTGR